MLMTNKNRLSLFFILLIFLVPILGTILPTKVYAAASGKWISDSKIEVSGDTKYNGTYINKSGDNSDALIRDTDTGYCVKEAQHLFNSDDADKLYKSDHVIRDVSGDKTSAKLNTYEAVAVTSQGTELSSDDFGNMSTSELGQISLIRCVRRDGPTSITLSEVSQATIEYVWLDEANIEKTDGKRLYVKDGSKFIWTKDGNSCKEYITTSGIGSGTLFYDGDKKVNGDCEYKKKPITLGSSTNATKAAGTGTTKSGETTGDLAALADEEPSCENGGGEWSWILCPALRIASSFVSFVDEKLNELLTLPSSYYESREVELAWSRMRNLAYAILIPIMLVMILATALGFDFISAYTFKKAMPRLVVAILFIALSLEITRFLVVLTNDVGQGVLGLITSSFNGAKDVTLASLFDPGGVTGGLFTGAVVVGGVIAVGLIPVLLLFLVSAGLAIAVAVLALAFRQMLLIAFMVIAPLAILAWIFPGNDKLWKLWWNAFTKLLILFPLIMFLIGAGRGFAALVQSTSSSNANPLDDDFVITILKLAAYVLPYFFIPAMFKFAGGIFATITGMTNDRSKGVFDRLKNARKSQTEKAWHRAKEENYFKGGNESGVRGALNKGIMGGTMLNEAGLRPKRMKDNMRRAIGNKDLEDSEEIMKSTEGRMLQDDDVGSALVDANGDEAAFRRILQERAYARFGGDENADALEAAVTGMRSLGRKHGAGALRLAALRSKFNSSTGWNNEPEYKTNSDGSFALDDKGNRQKVQWTQEDFEAGKCEESEVGSDKIWKYSASGDMLNDINKVAGANRIMSTQLLAEARAGQSRAGREDTGGGGFSDTAVEMDRLHRGDMITDSGTGQQRRYTIEDATEGVTRSLINGKNIYEIFRSGKPAVARAVAPVLKKMTQESLRSSAQIGQQAASLEADTQDVIATIQMRTDLTPQQQEVEIQRVRQTNEPRIAALKEQQGQTAIRAIVKEQMFHSVAATSSPDVAREMGDKIFNTKFDMDLLPDNLRQTVIQKTGGKTDPTHLEVFDALRDDPVWSAYAKEYGRASGRNMSPEEIRAEAERRGVTEAQLRAEQEAERRQQEEQQRPH